MLPSVRVTLRTLRPKGYSDAPKTLGEHLRRRRLELGLLQREAPGTIGIVHSAYLNWELDRVDPEIRYWPALIHFLGYDPQPEPETIGEWIATQRRRAGLARGRLAQLVGWDTSTIGMYEADRVLLSLERRRVLEAFLSEETCRGPQDLIAAAREHSHRLAIPAPPTAPATAHDRFC